MANKNETEISLQMPAEVGLFKKDEKGRYFLTELGEKEHATRFITVGKHAQGARLPGVGPYSLGRVITRPPRIDPDDQDDL